MVMQILLLFQYANVLPARQDGAIILPASQHKNHLVYLTSWQVITSWHASSHQRHSLIFGLNGLNNVGVCV